MSPPLVRRPKGVAAKHRKRDAYSEREHNGDTPWTPYGV
jgi:hypothetical protein